MSKIVTITLSVVITVIAAIEVIVKQTISLTETLESKVKLAQ